MIGGIDVKLPTFNDPQAVEVAVRSIRQLWPRAVFEDADSGARYDRFAQIPFGNVDELFVYRDAIAADGWDREGATPELHNTMVHLIDDPGRLTVVVDELSTDMQTIVSAIRSALHGKPYAKKMEAAA